MQIPAKIYLVPTPGEDGQIIWSIIDDASAGTGDAVVFLRGDLVDRGRRQVRMAEWCKAAFGSEHADSVEQRAVRFLEESIEAYQASGASAEMAHRLVDHIFSRPSGALAQELGGVGITLLLLAAAAGLSADDQEVLEMERVLSKSLQHFRDRNEAKNAAGFDVTKGGATSQRNDAKVNL
ncbi:MAG: hypothetical protein F8N36_13535 [Desulfovibrio sp.]|uniref:hypothetical protein n=1 Tax=Desulfovibrio sp. TaxID=885 RepID=UPI00135EAEBA|nr:hypothetical protein [Desulfovibrio sp.]MTJ93861.1 hypothetical protein [Desulfovibrio sp.]